MLRLLSAATAVALSATLAGAFGAVAQSADPPRQAQGESRADRLAEVKEALRLTPEQEPLWAPVADAVRNLHDAAPRAEQGAPGDAMERLRRHADRSASRAEALKRLADAAQPLWNALSEEQKRMLPRALRYAARMDDQERTSWRERDGERSDRMVRRDDMDRRMDRMHRDRRGDREDRWRDRRDRMEGRDFGMSRHDRWWREEPDDETRDRSDHRRMDRRSWRDDDRWDRDPREDYGRRRDEGRRFFDDDLGWRGRGDDDRDRRVWRGWDDDGRDRRGYGRDRSCD